MPAPRFRVGDWLADPALDELRRADELVKLEPRAMRVLAHLSERQGQVVSADELLDAVWPGLVVGQNSVYQAIAQLRRVFGDDSESPTYIATVPRKGYRLIAVVSSAENPVQPMAASSPQDSLPPLVDRRRKRPQRLWPMGFALAGILAALFWFARAPDAHAPSGGATVAVLPFTDLSPAKNNQAFCDGLTEELINSLARMTGLRVTARTSAFSFRAGTSDARTIGEKLSVTHLVEGSVRREGAQIRISAQLINVSTGFQEWAESFDRPFDDVLEVQESISLAVARALEVKLSHRARAVAASAPTANAYELYLLGRYQQLQRQPESIQRSIDYHRAAIAQDPSFALAYAGLANAYMLGYWYADYPIEMVALQVRENVARALAANPELADAYVARGRLLLETFDLAAAQQDFERAIALNASHSEAYIGLAMVFEYRGEPRQALPPLDQAAALDPLHVILHGRRCQVLQNLRRFPEAQFACRRVIELQPTFPNGYWGVALIELAQGNTDAAIRGYREALERAPHRIDLRNQLGWLYLDIGMTDAADVSFAKVSAGSAEFNGVELERARGWVARGDKSGLAAHLDTLPLRSSSNANDLLDAAAMEMVAGRAANANALLQRAVSDPSFNIVRRIENVWLTRWGRNDGITLAQVALATGDRLSAEKYLDITLAWLDRVERNGQLWCGAFYLRAAAHALQGRPDAAMQVLNRAHELGWRGAWWMRADPALDSLRTRADFALLVARIEADNAAARARLAAQRMARSAHTPTL
ncbi:MAG TPA: winged helix-turn-helix domain-containing protein [Steroidobacteraceae bacterium]|nr:winged helix-turn-helix domain-containing protein [Steroidobacteraceae bacterium]